MMTIICILLITEVGTLGYGIHKITCLTLRERLSKTNILSCEIM